MIVTTLNTYTRTPARPPHTRTCSYFMLPSFIWTLPNIRTNGHQNNHYFTVFMMWLFVMYRMNQVSNCFVWSKVSMPKLIGGSSHVNSMSPATASALFCAHVWLVCSGINYMIHTTTILWHSSEHPFSVARLQCISDGDTDSNRTTFLLIDGICKG